MSDTSEPAESRGSTTWDRLAAELQGLRHRAGDPSYAQIARRVEARRREAGIATHAAPVARTTVYDAFRTGRTRVNLRLVREIALALGADDAAVDRWIAESRASGAAATASEPPASGRSASTVPTTDSENRSTGRTLALMVACVLLNLAGRLFVDAFDLPIFLDMVGTAIVAIAIGPWWGAAVGGATNVVGVLSSGPASLVFAAVNVAGALVWGYGVHRLGLGRTLPRFLALNLLVAGACSVVAVPILLTMFGGTTGHGQDVIAATYLGLTHVQTLAIAASNLLVSMADKVIGGFIALVVLSAAPRMTSAEVRHLLPASIDAPAPAR